MKQVSTVKGGTTIGRPAPKTIDGRPRPAGSLAPVTLDVALDRARVEKERHGPQQDLHVEPERTVSTYQTASSMRSGQLS